MTCVARGGHDQLDETVVDQDRCPSCTSRAMLERRETMLRAENGVVVM